MSAVCDACRRPASLGHILHVLTAQGSPGMIGLSPWCRMLRIKPGGPATAANAGLPRPDLIFRQRDRPTYLLDVTVVVDNAVFHDAHLRKVQYYDGPDIRNWIARNISNNAVIVSSVTLSWRGLMASTSANTWCAALGLGRQALSLLSAVICERSLWIWKHFHRSNFRVPERLAD